MAEKKSEFVVTDRRRFGTEGEARPDAQVIEDEKNFTVVLPLIWSNSMEKII